jgi:hypothetical protein
MRQIQMTQMRERGARNLAKLAKIAEGSGAPEGGRVTCWNPTPDNVLREQSLTVHKVEARVMTLLYDGKLDAAQQEGFQNQIATLSGFLKMLKLSWQEEYRKLDSLRIEEE